MATVRSPCVELVVLKLMAARRVLISLGVEKAPPAFLVMTRVLEEAV